MGRRIGRRIRRVVNKAVDKVQDVKPKNIAKKIKPKNIVKKIKSPQIMRAKALMRLAQKTRKLRAKRIVNSFKQLGEKIAKPLQKVGKLALAVSMVAAAPFTLALVCCVSVIPGAGALAGFLGLPTEGSFKDRLKGSFKSVLGTLREIGRTIQKKIAPIMVKVLEHAAFALSFVPGMGQVAAMMCTAACMVFMAIEMGFSKEKWKEGWDDMALMAIGLVPMGGMASKAAKGAKAASKAAKAAKTAKAAKNTGSVAKSAKTANKTAKAAKTGKAAKIGDAVIEAGFTSGGDVIGMAAARASRGVVKGTSKRLAKVGEELAQSNRAAQRFVGKRVQDMSELVEKYGEEAVMLAVANSANEFTRLGTTAGDNALSQTDNRFAEAGVGHAVASTRFSRSKVDRSNDDSEMDSKPPAVVKSRDHDEVSSTSKPHSDEHSDSTPTMTTSEVARRPSKLTDADIARLRGLATSDQLTIVPYTNKDGELGYCVQAHGEVKRTTEVVERLRAVTGDETLIANRVHVEGESGITLDELRTAGAQFDSPIEPGARGILGGGKSKNKDTPPKAVKAAPASAKEPKAYQAPARVSGRVLARQAARQKLFNQNKADHKIGHYYTGREHLPPINPQKQILQFADKKGVRAHIRARLTEDLQRGAPPDDVELDPAVVEIAKNMPKESKFVSVPENYGGLGEKRIQYAAATILPRDGGDKKARPADPYGGINTAIDDRGHLAPEKGTSYNDSHRINGPDNIIAENLVVNQQYKTEFELVVKKYAEDNPDKLVQTLHVPHYGSSKDEDNPGSEVGKRPRPKAVTHYVVVDGTIVSAFTFKNSKQPIEPR